MLDPAELLDAARLLVDASNSTPPPDGQLRRAISTAYYALFHKVLDSAATRFMGTNHRHRPGFSLLYRGFNHGRMKSICKSIDVALLSQTYARHLGVARVSQDMRDFASVFVALQEARHTADYDPHWAVAHTDAIGLVDQADLGIQAFDRPPRRSGRTYWLSCWSVFVTSLSRFFASKNCDVRPRRGHSVRDAAPVRACSRQPLRRSG